MSASPRRSTPAQRGFAMPAEWEPHRATWLAWPHRADAMFKAKEAGQAAEKAVRGYNTWVRNNDLYDLDTPGEIGDVYMMLNRFAVGFTGRAPEECLDYKLETKGFK